MVECVWSLLASLQAPLRRVRKPSNQTSGRIMNSFMQNNFMNLMPGAFVQQHSPFINHNPIATPTVAPTQQAAIPTEFFALPNLQQQIEIQRLAAAAQFQLLRQQQVLQQLNVFSNSSHFHPNKGGQFRGQFSDPNRQFCEADRQAVSIIQSKQRSVSPLLGYHTVFTGAPKKEAGIYLQPRAAFHSNLQKEALVTRSPASEAENSREGSPSSDICTEIKAEILKQLKLEQEELNSGREVTEVAEVAKVTEVTELIENKENTDDRMAQRNNRRFRQSGYSAPFQGGRRGIQRPHSGNLPSHSPDGVTGLHPQQLSAIDNHIMAHYNQNKQPEDMYARKMQLRDALYEVMKGVFPYCGLYVVGSSMNGFGSSHSDMDLCLMLSHCEIDQRSEATEILRVLFKSLKPCDFLREIKIIKAKVPILRFVDKLSNVECDLNINNGTGIRNTHLLNAYSRCDWRLNPLVLFIKFWAKFHNINDAKNCTLSSYSLVLMVIHFLHVGVSPSVLPCLQQLHPQKFSPTLDIRTISLSESLPEFNSKNNQSVGELFVSFLNYYAHVFDFENNAISVRLGSTLPRSVVQRQNPIVNPPSQWKCICIEEPFNLSNTSRSVYDHYIFTRIQRVFTISYSRLQQTGDLHSAINFPI